MNGQLLHLVRKLKLWLEGFASGPHAVFALFGCALIEASIFPLPPDIPLIALGVSHPRRSLLYALVVVAGSSVGAVFGYYIGHLFYDAAGQRIVESFGLGGEFQLLLHQYQLNAWPVLLLAGFTPIPFMAFTIAAGFTSSVDPTVVFFAALCGRLIRFMPIGTLLYVLGPRVKYYFDHYLGRTVLFGGLAIVLFFIMSKSLR